MAKVLYLSYDGISDPLGQSQVLPYVLGLARLGHTIHLISFEKAVRFQVLGERLHEVMREAGIVWHPQPYTKQPPVLSTVWDLHRLRRAARLLQREHHFDLVHCRSYVAALAGIELKRHGNVKFVFDMRGLWADEKVEGGAWDLRNPLFRSIYRFFKAREAEFVTEADAIVSLSHAGRREVKRWLAYHKSRPPIAVVPCAAPFSEFDVSSADVPARAREELGIPADAYVVVYHGSLGTWYMLQEMLDWFAILSARRARSWFLIMTPESPDIVRNAATRGGLDLSRLVVMSAEHERVPFYLRAADVGLFFVRPTFSKRASCPTKLGELLALGIPVVTNAGIGDVDDILKQVGAGLIVADFSAAAYYCSIDQLSSLEDVDPVALRERARQLLDLPAAVDAYDALYRGVLQRRDSGRLPQVAG